VPDQFVGAAGDLNASRTSMRFHATREIDRLSPEVVGEFFAANDASHHRTGVYADAEGELATAEQRARDGGLHVEGQVDKCGRVVWPAARHAGSDHVAVANSLDLLQVVFLDQPVEAKKHLVE